MCCDSLLTPAADLLSLAGVDNGFDVVASNPPYVKLQNLSPDYREQLEAQFHPFIKGSYSLSLLFLIAGYRMLGEDGQLAFITQNNLFTSLAGEPIRHLLQQQGCLRRILDFGHADVAVLVELGADPGGLPAVFLVERPGARVVLQHPQHSCLEALRSEACFGVLDQLVGESATPHLGQ